LIPVVVTGARGYVGTRLVKELSNRGIEVIEVDASGPEGVDLSSEEASDFLSSFLPSEFDLIHLAFPLPGTMPGQKMREVVNRMNSSLLRMKNAPRKSLLISSTAVYSPDTAMNFSPWEVYGDLKSQAETQLEKLGALSIIRPGTLIDASRHSAVATIYRRALLGRLSILPEGGSLAHPFLHVDDLVEACCSWQASADLILKTTDLWATEPVSALTHMELRGVKPRILKLPKVLQQTIGSDNLPLGGVSKWHLRALSYDVTGRTPGGWAANPPRKMRDLLDLLLLPTHSRSTHDR
jgi:hypothetical protein